MVDFIQLSFLISTQLIFIKFLESRVYLIFIKCQPMQEE